jgi:hypothetical protein
MTTTIQCKSNSNQMPTPHSSIAISTAAAGM